MFKTLLDPKVEFVRWCPYFELETLKFLHKEMWSGTVQNRFIWILMPIPHIPWNSPPKIRNWNQNSDRQIWCTFQIGQIQWLVHMENPINTILNSSFNFKLMRAKTLGQRFSMFIKTFQISWFHVQDTSLVVTYKV